MEEIVKQIQKTKKASRELNSLNEHDRVSLLLSLAQALKENIEIILEENKKDLALMSIDDPKYDRLLLSKDSILSIAQEVELVSSQANVLDKCLEKKTRQDGLHLKKVSVPLGVVGVIYESRPNVTIDVFALCFKSGNACILKGGKEAFYSNQVLAGIITQVLIKHKINQDIFYLMPATREATQVLLNAVNLVDVCIPRGSQALIDFVRSQAKIPVIETGAGIVHAYFDLSGDLIKGKLVIENAKTRRVSVCNALDCLIIHEKRLLDLWELIEPLAEKEVEILADEQSYKYLQGLYPEILLKQASYEDFGKEFLSYKMAIKTVSSLNQAIDHILEYTSNHSEAIISEDEESIDHFLKYVDAAALYVNASTAFTDGNQFGMGAEIGISTQKLHVRGPMGVEALTSYKWLIYGNGHIRK